MKITLVLCFVMFGLCLSQDLEREDSERPLVRRTRFLASGRCPENLTKEKCEEKMSIEDKKYCTKTTVTDSKHYSIAGCGSVGCAKNQVKRRKNATAAYPDCCEICV